MPRTILYVCNDAYYFAQHRAHVASRMVREGWTVHVATGGDPGFLPAALSAIRSAIRLDVDRASFRLRTDARLTRQIRAATLATTPDVVHFITMKPIVFGGLALLWPKAGNAAPSPRIVATFPGLGRVFEGDGVRRRLVRLIVLFILRRLFRSPNAVATFENHADMERLQALGVAFRGGARAIAGAGLDLERFAPAASRTDGRFKVLWASRLLHGKGLAAYLGAARDALKQRYDIEFLVAGYADPTHADSLSRAEIDALSDEPAIVYLGHVTDMAGLLSRVDAVVLPSLYAEGLPRFLIEAAATGLPSIASDNPGCREIVVDGVSGIILKEISAAAILDAVRSLSCDRDRARKMGEAAYAHVSAGGFSQEAVQETFMECYGQGETPEMGSGPA